MGAVSYGIKRIHAFIHSFIHSFPLGWVPCEGTALGDSLGRCGYVMSVGAPAVLDLSPVGGPSRQLTLSQWPQVHGGWPANAWTGGRNAPGAVPNSGGISED